MTRFPPSRLFLLCFFPLVEMCVNLRPRFFRFSMFNFQFIQRFPVLHFRRNLNKHVSDIKQVSSDRVVSP